MLEVFHKSFESFWLICSLNTICQCIWIWILQLVVHVCGGWFVAGGSFLTSWATIRYPRLWFVCALIFILFLLLWRVWALEFAIWSSMAEICSLSRWFCWDEGWRMWLWMRYMLLRLSNNMSVFLWSIFCGWLGLIFFSYGNIIGIHFEVCNIK